MPQIQPNTAAWYETRNQELGLPRGTRWTSERYQAERQRQQQQLHASTQAQYQQQVQQAEQERLQQQAAHQQQQQQEQQQEQTAAQQQQQFQQQLLAQQQQQQEHLFAQQMQADSGFQGYLASLSEADRLAQSQRPDSDVWKNYQDWIPLAAAAHAEKQAKDKARRDDWDRMNKQGAYDPDGWQSTGYQPDPIAMPDWWDGVVSAPPAATTPPPATAQATGQGIAVPGAVQRPDGATTPPPPHIQELLDLHGPAPRPAGMQGRMGSPPATNALSRASAPATSSPAPNALLGPTGAQSWTPAGQTRSNQNQGPRPWTPGGQSSNQNQRLRAWTPGGQGNSVQSPQSQTSGPSNWGSGGGQRPTPGQRRMGY